MILIAYGFEKPDSVFVGAPVFASIHCICPKAKLDRTTVSPLRSSHEDQITSPWRGGVVTAPVSTSIRLWHIMPATNSVSRPFVLHQDAARGHADRTRGDLPDTAVGRVDFRDAVVAVMGDVDQVGVADREIVDRGFELHDELFRARIGVDPRQFAGQDIDDVEISF